MCVYVAGEGRGEGEGRSAHMVSLHLKCLYQTLYCNEQYIKNEQILPLYLHIVHIFVTSGHPRLCHILLVGPHCPELNQP